jgi:predicted RNA-binding protein with PUA domain
MAWSSTTITSACCSKRAPGTLPVWAESFTKLRLPKLFDLRADPYDFALLIKGTCLTEKSKFLVPLVDYIVMKNNAPDSDQSEVLSAANSVITQYYDVAVKNFIEKRSNR